MKRRGATGSVARERLIQQVYPALATEPATILDPGGSGLRLRHDPLLRDLHQRRAGTGVPLRGGVVAGEAEIVHAVQDEGAVGGVDVGRAGQILDVGQRQRQHEVVRLAGDDVDVRLGRVHGAELLDHRTDGSLNRVTVRDLRYHDETSSKGFSLWTQLSLLRTMHMLRTKGN
jgi:ribosomal protein S8E